MKRLDYLDNIAGILICYMMLMHILLWKTIPLDNNSLWLEPLKFFMFWFFFKSGMFYRMKSTRECAIRGGQEIDLSIRSLLYIRLRDSYFVYLFFWGQKLDTLYSYSYKRICYRR